MENSKLAIVGATGLVGGMVLEILASGKLISNLNPDNILLVASERSVGKKINFLGQGLKVISVTEAIAQKPEYVIMSAGAGTSKENAEKFVEVGSIVIDNSSAWRTYTEIPLITPSVSPWNINREEPQIIANPNCVAIMLAIAIAPFTCLNIEHISVSVMQAVSGAGFKGLRALEEETKNDNGKKSKISNFVSNIYDNIIPASADSKTMELYNDEEAKMMFEVPKILSKDLKMSAQSNRVPIKRGHSATIRVTFAKDYKKQELIELLKKAPQIKYTEEPLGPYDVVGKDYVIIRSFRQDSLNSNVFEFFTTSDNLRVGAAYNAVAILAKILDNYSEKNYS